MKKNIYYATALAMVLSLASCGQSGSESSEETTTAQTTTTAVTTEATTTTTTVVTTTAEPTTTPEETTPAEDKEPTPEETKEKPTAVLKTQTVKKVNYDYEEIYSESEYNEDGKCLSKMKYQSGMYQSGVKDKERIYEYDENSRLIKESLYTHHLSHHYDEFKNLVEDEDNYDPPILHSYTTYEYDGDLLLKKEEHTNCDEYQYAGGYRFEIENIEETIVTTTYEYNDKKDIIKETIQKSPKRTEINEYDYTYDKDGKITEIEMTMIDPLGEKTSRKSTYKYDTKGNLTEIDGVLPITKSRVFDYNYDEETDEYYDYRDESQKILYEYDSNNHLKSEKCGVEDIAIWLQIDYDTNGNVIRNYYYNNRHGWEKFYQYEYDENNNKISEYLFFSELSSSNSSDFDNRWNEAIKEETVDDKVYRAYYKLIYENTYY